MENAIAEVLTGRRVAAVSGGGRLDLTLTGPVTVRIGHEFRFAAPSEVEHFYPALTFTPSPPLLALVGRAVAAAEVTMAGGLELAFDGGGRISVLPHAQLAPWSVFTPRGAVCAGLAGGEVVWAERP